MVSSTLVISSFLVLGVSILYFIVGRAVLDPTAPRPERLARSAFSLWWFCLAAFTAKGAIQKALAASEVRDIAIYASLEYIGLTFLFVGLAGLMYYLLYLYTGRTWVIYPISIFYGLFLLVGFYVVTLENPVGLKVGTWNVALDYAHKVDALIFNLLMGALILPLIGGVLLYFLLYFMVDAPVQKKRIMLVGGALLFWFGTSGLAIATNLSDLALWGLVSRVIAFIAALIILYAFTLLEKRHKGHADIDGATTDAHRGDSVRFPHDKILPVC